MQGRYVCPVCKVSVKVEKLHDHYVAALKKMLNREGYKTIREGKMPKEGWHEPDLFVLRGLWLEKIIEVIIFDPYEGDDRSVRVKVQKVRDYY